MTDMPGDEQQTELGFGETLRKAREDASYSVAYIASQTHLHADIIKALEEEQFEQLPGDVFMRGYIRTYTKILGLDAQSLIDAYEKSKPEDLVPTTSVIKPNKRRSTGVDPVVIWSTVTVATILLGLLISWWTHRDTEAPVQLASATEQFEAPLATEAIKESNDNKPSSSEHEVSLGDVSPDINSSLQTPSIDIAPQTQTEQQASIPNQRSSVMIEAPLSGGNVDKVRIIVRYKEESWTEIFDARKRRLLHGLIQPGAVRVISGQAPFNVFLGNSPGVELEINGKPFDHSPYVRRNNTARFLIDDTSS